LACRPKFATQLFTTTATSAASTTALTPRVKTVDAVSPTEKPVVIKGWVRTVRKQKTLAFVEVNDGSNIQGLQAVLVFDDLDEETKKGGYDGRCFYLGH
jgi:asparaginyl-tRNA synthetase